MNNIIPSISFMLSQTNNATAPSAGGGASSASAGTATTSSSSDAPAPKGMMDGPYSSLIMIALMFGVFYFLLIRPQQKKAKEHQKLINSIGKGSEVVTTGGLIGRVTGVGDKLLTLEISEKVRVRVLRSQVAGLYSAADNAEKK